MPSQLISPVVVRRTGSPDPVRNVFASAVVRLKPKHMLHDLTLFQKTYDFLLWIKPTVQRFAKVHKYSLGLQLENETLELLKCIIRANISRTKKTEIIEEALVHFETVVVLIRLAKDFNLINIKQYEFSSKNLAEIGRLLGGWKKKFE